MVVNPATIRSLHLYLLPTIYHSMKGNSVLSSFEQQIRRASSCPISEWVVSVYQPNSVYGFGHLPYDMCWWWPMRVCVCQTHTQTCDLTLCQVSGHSFNKLSFNYASRWHSKPFPGLMHSDISFTSCSAAVFPLFHLKFFFIVDRLFFDLSWKI